MRTRYEYCRILVNHADVHEVKELAGNLLSGQFERRYMSVGEVELEVRRNPDSSQEGTDRAEFVFWPVQVELEFTGESSSARAMVETTEAVVRAIWDSGAMAVAACDYEDESPWKGGIVRLRGR